VSGEANDVHNLRSKNWWLCYGALVWGVPFFVAMTAFWAITLFFVESLLQSRIDWKFYGDPRIHAVALLIFSLVASLSGGFSRNLAVGFSPTHTSLRS
jgi:hypothetical protein